LANSVEFVRVPSGDMQQVGLALLHRDGERTLIYCQASHISAELARNMSENGTRYSQTTVRHDHPVSPRQHVRFQPLDPADMPGDVSPLITTLRDGGSESVTYYRADMMTPEMARALELICAEETRYFVHLPVISPAARPGPVPEARRPPAGTDDASAPHRRP
jgi:hypothetical protein